MTQGLSILAIGAVALMLAALLLMRAMAREERVRSRILAVQRSVGVDPSGGPPLCRP